GPGRPLLYATSDKFMDYLGIKTLADLPKPKDFKEVENSIGEAPAVEESMPGAAETEQDF
ncbi:MAG: SMC-Scp complex subunit ScpB, partial [Saprospiraceae bacterium]|nr:SMC-Scp complex subunit ScpB [Saprospiraceae bacterium]